MRLHYLDHRIRGFTTIELVTTILLIGILVAVALPRIGKNSGFEERAFRDDTLAALRYAQKSAIAARRTTCAAITPTSVTVSISTAFNAATCAGGLTLIGPDDKPLVVTARGGAAFSPVPGSVIFDAGGRPIVGAGTLSFAGLPAALALTVEAETGHVH
jgi:MSHA pilin protein MshC